ncbi:MAG: dihydroorotase [Bdellovibrionales bacterium]
MNKNVTTLFKNAHLYDPLNKIDGLGSILVKDGKIEETHSTAKADQEIDLKGLHLFPGFIDIHVHLREPGDEHKETIATGSRAAASGGFTSVCAMPNTSPVNDSVLVTKYILDKAALESVIRVHPISAASKGLNGQEMVEYGAMINAGCVAVSDDGRCVMDSFLARKVLEYLKDFDVPFVEHCEDCQLSAHGSMNEGRISYRNGLTGVPHAAEDVIVTRDVALARTTGGKLHLAHLSSRHSVKALNAAKIEGLRVSGEVTPHHLLLNEECLETLDTNFKMAPPLRTEEDRKTLVEALEKGVIEAIATDHAPHSVQEKAAEFAKAPNGVIGLETAFATCMTLVEKKELSFARLITSLTSGPAKIMGFLDRGGLKKGMLADFAIVDLNKEYTINQDTLFSKSRNSPFMGWKVKGQVQSTYVGGVKVFERT